MNTPNKLSLLRIALIPVMVVLLYLAHRSADEVSSVWFILATVVFAGASFTDYLDGHLARKNDQITDFGKFLDPVADKLLVLSAFIMLIQPGLMPAWATVIILARELCVDGLRMVAVGQGRVIAAAHAGKIKTVSQIILVMWLMIIRIPAFGHWLGAILTVWTLCITIWSGIEYFRNNADVIARKK